jgi:hypothetical protein
MRLHRVSGAFERSSNRPIKGAASAVPQQAAFPPYSPLKSAPHRNQFKFPQKRTIDTAQFSNILCTIVGAIPMQERSPEVTISLKVLAPTGAAAIKKSNPHQ